MLNKLKVKGAGGVLMLSLAAFGFVTPASAQFGYDVKSYPSTMCASSSAVSYSASQAYMSEGAGYLLCPLVKDMSGTDSGAAVYVDVRDTNSAFDIYCTLYIHDYGSGSALDWDSQSTSGAPGNTTLNLSVDIGGSDAFNRETLQCQFTTSGSSLRLRGYTVYEFGHSN